MTADAFAHRFADAWRQPTAERLVALLHPDVTLFQPLSKPIRGREAARLEFEHLLEWLPDLRGEVHRWTAANDVVFIEWRLGATVAGRRVEWPIVDRFLLKDGLGFERAAYFNPLPLLVATLVGVSGWPKYRRYARRTVAPRA